jgi:hypothetical protein
MFPYQVFYPAQQTPAATIAGAFPATVTLSLFIAKTVKSGN